MKKISFLILFLVCSIFVIGQINPVKNLFFQDYYDSPTNCYVLSWQTPDSSKTDTLIGYNIYRNKDFYKFTTQPHLCYDPCTKLCGMTNDSGGLIFYNVYPFYVYVKAVYDNSLKIESSSVDSVNIGSFAINIKEIKNNDHLRILNIHQENNTIKIQLSESINGGDLEIINTLGEMVQRKHVQNENSEVEVDVNMSPGLYIVSLRYKQKIISEKIIMK